MFTRRTTFTFALASALLISGQAFAHRIHLSETEIVVDAKGHVEIVHAFHVDDMARALFRAKILETPSLMSLRARAQASLYVEETFDISIVGQPATLSIIGAEVIGETLYVYQEAAIPAPLSDWTISAQMLHDIVPDQKAMVNVRRKGKTRSLTFFKGDGAKKVLA